ncbi:hypothetical protein UO65_3886 [Actinokineospora spheciospongiae]|uniref:Uncharacterized protein n=1 Tax=Actinokineospora spheciospongiae TaxID=909613 RepID=W7IKG9_9PSEU|nr:hypothetical protein [Actinokineospora spheciospongiae]EWC60833.1 hypothetical protein UO65_3886 [Actinokineospora spheciospongiae]PWW64564.1 hypothetical protein DFQ13_103538 [Actinokineospora spheciospongiae]
MTTTTGAVLDRTTTESETFDNVFEGTASISVQATEYHKIPGSSDTRSKYDEI